MKKVSFTEMKHGTKEDYLILDKHEKDFERGTAEESERQQGDVPGVLARRCGSLSQRPQRYPAL